MLRAAIQQLERKYFLQTPLRLQGPHDPLSGHSEALKGMPNILAHLV